MNDKKQIAALYEAMYKAMISKDTVALGNLLSEDSVLIHTLTDIVDRMHFSSQPMLTRYLKRVTGKTPSQYRKDIKK